MRLIFPEIGTKIWAWVAQPGMIVETPAGERIELEHVVEGYNTVTLDNGWGRTVTVEYASLVEVLGYFNPESRS